MNRRTTQAAREGDRAALDALLSGHLPLLYNIVGRALDGHPDVDDIVQETMLDAVRGIGELRDPAAFRSWLVAIATHRIRDRDRRRRTAPAPVADPDAVPERPGAAADFTELTILRLGLAGQRREVAEATRWLDPGDRRVLSLWWLEVTGELTRPELARALGLSRPHTAVRVQRLRERLDAARSLVRALDADPRCPDLDRVTAAWDGTPGSVWRKRIARHLRACPRCGRPAPDRVPAERLIAGLALVPVPAGLTVAALLKAAPGTAMAAAGATGTTGTTGTAGATATTGASSGASSGAFSGALKLKLLAHPVAVAAAGVTLAAGGVYVVQDRHPAPPPAAASAPTAATKPAAAPPSRTPASPPTTPAAPTPTGSPSPTPSPRPSAAPAPRYGSVVDGPEPAPDPSRAPAPLPYRPAPGLTATGETVMEHRDDTITLTGRGYVRVRWQLVPEQRPGHVVMPTWTGLDGRLFHVASGGGRRLDDQIPTSPVRPHTWMGSDATGYAVLPPGTQQMWQNEYYYLDGTVTLRQNERGADYNLSVRPVTPDDITRDVTSPPDPERNIVRYGHVRGTGTDAAPVPQHIVE
ncbi:RNA polymerase sigma factor [Streptomyces sp. TRM64462]|uniref:RNA polymerase sigma factor n=1 Tax=Streptomyces sp. TRM64462 TaxID=2741726 RepID=UPI001585FBC6|nr:sigma-70 family RNA polymerase sigma factor [Streptomyces sp. TRM64462]